MYRGLSGFGSTVSFNIGAEDAILLVTVTHLIYDTAKGDEGDVRMITKI